ncbi:MAG TPA: AMP-binding protein, partial [Gammaproteobacteria bacterium]|nr:AMP-binding protein [Gammaproteobacteria bacterium]
MEKLWLKQYPAEVPAEIDIKRYASVKQIFEESCAKFGSLPAYVNMGVAISYAELDAASARFGAWLQQERGFKRGDRVAIMMPNLLQYPVALFGILRAGLTVVNV